MFNFIIWKFTGLKKILTVIVFNNLINVPSLNLILTFLT